MESAFPKAVTVWNGAILGTIVKCIATARRPGMCFTQGWTGRNYEVNGGDGRFGVVTFDGPMGNGFGLNSTVVGTFYSVNSARNRPDRDMKGNVEEVFRGCPAHARVLAVKETLRFMLVEGFSGPVVTTAFWNEGDRLTAVEPWAEVLRNGADVMEIQLTEDIDTALSEWDVQFGFCCVEEGLTEGKVHLGKLSPQVEVARGIHYRKVAQPEGAVTLTVAEAAFLTTQSADSAPVQLCRECFAQIGIVMP